MAGNPARAEIGPGEGVYCRREQGCCSPAKGCELLVSCQKSSSPGWFGRGMAAPRPASANKAGEGEDPRGPKASSEAELGHGATVGISREDKRLQVAAARFGKKKKPHPTNPRKSRTTKAPCVLNPASSLINDGGQAPLGIGRHQKNQSPALKPPRRAGGTINALLPSGAALSPGVKRPTEPETSMQSPASAAHSLGNLCSGVD